MSGCLDPFDPREAFAIKDAAWRVGKPNRTIYRWCVDHGIGRQIGPRVWHVSLPALWMYADGDHETLKAYLAGNRESQAVESYYLRCGLGLALESIRREKERRGKIFATQPPQRP
jgi:hypothetical protein